MSDDPFTAWAIRRDSYQIQHELLKDNIEHFEFGLVFKEDGTPNVEELSDNSLGRIKLLLLAGWQLLHLGTEKSDELLRAVEAELARREK